MNTDDRRGCRHASSGFNIHTASNTAGGLISITHTASPYMLREGYYELPHQGEATDHARRTRTRRHAWPRHAQLHAGWRGDARTLHSRKPFEGALIDALQAPAYRTRAYGTVSCRRQPPENTYAPAAFRHYLRACAFLPPILINAATRISELRQMKLLPRIRRRMPPPISHNILHNRHTCAACRG